MASLRELVESPALAPLLAYVSGPRRDSLVQGVTLIDDLPQLERVSEHDIVLVYPGAFAVTDGHDCDRVLQAADDRGVAALVLSADDVRCLTSTATTIVSDARPAILRAGEDTEPMRLALAIGRELLAAANIALLRVYTAVRAIEVHPRDGDTESMLAHAGAALGVEISTATSEPHDRPRRAVVVEDRVESWVTAPKQEGDAEMSTEIVLHVAATSIADALTRARRPWDLPTQSSEEVLTDLLSAMPKAREQVVQRARRLGLPIDGWHVAVRLDFENLSDTAPGEELAVYQERVRFGAAALQAARAAGGTWHQARAGEAFVLVKTYTEDPGLAASAAVASGMDEILGVTRGTLPSAVIRCGVGTARAGPTGLLGSVAEAKAATIAARTIKRVNNSVPFDTVGLRRALVEWYASDTAREAAASVLQPLAALGGIRAERSIQTLHVYLDEHGSLTRTGQRLNLHRNAVAYRIHKIFELLDVDQENPDDLLLLALACRARELD